MSAPLLPGKCADIAKAAWMTARHPRRRSRRPAPSHRGVERVRTRHGPGVPEPRVAGALEQLARPQCRIEVGKGQHLARRDAAAEVNRTEFMGMIEPGGGGQLG